MSPVSDADQPVSFRDERILVTGGAGLIGSTIIDQLLPHGPREIVVFDDFSRGRLANIEAALDSGLVTVVEGDVRDRRAVAEVVAGIDVVYHQAAIRITRCAEEPRTALEVLADGTFNVVEAAASEGVRRLVAASSASVYGQAEVLPTAEDHHPWDNETLYGAAKQFNEGVLRAFRQTHGLDYIALRYFNVYGPRMDIFGVYTEVLVRWMERIEAGEPPLILGDGSQTMDFVHVADVARANVAAGTAACEGEVFNVGRGISTSLAELAALLTKVMGAEQLTPVHGPERATNAVHSRRADVSKARELLGFEAEMSLEAGLADLVDWWRASRLAEAEAGPDAASLAVAG